MINTTIFKSAFILLAISSLATSYPVDPVDQIDVQGSKPSTTSESPAVIIPGDHYDQRQNGSKNFRIHVDGLFFVVLPAEALLLAGELDPSLIGTQQQQQGANTSGSDKPGASINEVKDKPSRIQQQGNEPFVKQKSSHGHAYRLSNLLGPILRHISP